MSENNNWPDPVDAYFGHVVYVPGGECGPRTQPDVQIVHVVRGSARVRIDDKLRRLEEGEAGLLLPGHREHFRFDPQRHTEHTWVAMRYRPLPEPLREQLADGPWRLRPHAGFIDLVRLGLWATRSPLAGHALRVKLATAALITLVTPEHVDSYTATEAPPTAWRPWVGQPATIADDRLPPPVRAALTFMASHLHEPVALSDLAEAAHVSGGHLSRQFRNALGTGPMQRLWQMRVDRGVELLRFTGLNVTEAAMQSGFTSPQHFARLVRSRTGRTPRQWRHQSESAE